MRTTAPILSLWATLAAFFVGSELLHAGQYQIVNLGGQNRIADVYNPQINNAGQVLMETSTSTGIWQNGVYTPVNLPGGTPYTPFGLNNLGDIGGGTFSPIMRPVLGQGGQATFLDIPPGVPAAAQVGAGPLNDGSRGRSAHQGPRQSRLLPG